jgi:hypothetical protein
MNEHLVTKIGWFASLTAMIMFSSYLDQIRLNIEGYPGSVVLPVATIINCTAWVCYALSKRNKDWPIFACNVVGIIAGSITTITALAY